MCVIHPCAGVLPFWVPYLPNPLTDFFDIWRIGSPYLHPPNLPIRLAISFLVVEIYPYLCHLPLHSVSYILSDLGIRSHNSHQTSHIVSHRYSASTIKIASHSEQPFLPTVASTLCLHFVPYLLHLCRFTCGNLYTATRCVTLDTCQSHSSPISRSGDIVTSSQFVQLSLLPQRHCFSTNICRYLLPFGA